jgi:hypothetical protein
MFENIQKYTDTIRDNNIAWKELQAELTQHTV